VNDGKDLLDPLRLWLRARLPPKTRAALRRRLTELHALRHRQDLPRLARIYGSDKWGVHWYCRHYEHHFAHLRRRRIVLLEIGIGGYDDPEDGGGSLRMWRRYFPRGRIYGLDIADKSPHNERRIHTFRGDQSDERFLAQVIEQIGPPDIVVDDGSHVNEHVIKTFHCLFPRLADGGIYVVEDTQTSYWPEFGGSSENLGTAPTSMGLLKSLVDGLNHAEYIRPGYRPSYFDRHIVAMHFYHNLVFIHKGSNDEKSNLIARDP
jgi:hypothetical protein